MFRKFNQGQVQAFRVLKEGAVICKGNKRIAQGNALGGSRR